nr:MAG TPA: hypothetical protein [Caudoviricetes sp.]
MIFSNFNKSKWVCIRQYRFIFSKYAYIIIT